jgi:NAD(P)-dependent dehydrogenase (short-subunit alcohol dehydrogenase family)
MYRTAEGLEATFAANHLSAFLLTRELLPLLRAAAATRAPGTVRVIAVSSSGHQVCTGMHWADLNMFGGFTTMGAYTQAKLANILFTRELDRRVAGDGIVAQAMHPGVVGSNFWSHGTAELQAYQATRDTDAPDVPARTLAWMATAPEAGAPGSRYFFDCAEAESAPQARDDAAAARLWRESERMLTEIGA